MDTAVWERYPWGFLATADIIWLTFIHRFGTYETNDSTRQVPAFCMLSSNALSIVPRSVLSLRFFASS